LLVDLSYPLRGFTYRSHKGTTILPSIPSSIPYLLLYTAFQRSAPHE
jgi:hypothetical protein